MTPRAGAGGAAVLFAALFPAACLQTLVLPPPGQTGGTGGTATGGGGNPWDAGGATDGAADRNTTCSSANTALAIRRPWPSIVVAVDHTNSMSSSRLGGNDFKLEVVASALHSRLNKYGPVVRFGYVEFPGDSRSCSNMMSTCCVGSVTPPAANTENGIMAALDQCNPVNQGCGLGDAAPAAQMFAAVSMAYTDLLSAGNVNPSDLELRSILLLTDGEPGCAAGASGDPCMQAANEIAKLSNQGIKTSVVAIGDVAGTADTHGGNVCLNSMANVSGVVRSMVSPFYYPALSESLLGTYLTGIITEAVCHIELLDLTADSSRTTIQFIVPNSSGGTSAIPVPRDISKSNGWDYEKGTADTRVAFYGAACGDFIDTVLNGGIQRVRVQGCPVAPTR